MQHFRRQRRGRDCGCLQDPCSEELMGGKEMFSSMRSLRLHLRRQRSDGWLLKVAHREVRRLEGCLADLAAEAAEALLEEEEKERDEKRKEVESRPKRRPGQEALAAPATSRARRQKGFHGLQDRTQILFESFNVPGSWQELELKLKEQAFVFVNKQAGELVATFFTGGHGVVFDHVGIRVCGLPSIRCTVAMWGPVCLSLSPGPLCRRFFVLRRGCCGPLRRRNMPATCFFFSHTRC